MQHQDWNPIVLNNNTNKTKEKERDKIISQKKPDEQQKVIVPPTLGKIIGQARGNKTRNVLAQQLGVSEIVLTRWETGKDVPTNSDIAKIERTLGVKLPRIKKVKRQES